MANNEALRTRLKHIYWIGGGSGSGKSTIAKHLADRYGMRLYSTDETIRDHGQRTQPAERPLACEFERMGMDERWLNRSPETMFATFHFFQGECFDRIVEDLLGVPPVQQVIAEGFRLLPELVKPLLFRAHQGVWLLPTPEFRRSAFESRGTLWDIARKTSEPERALQNLLVRDGMFTNKLRQDTRSSGLPAIEVDASVSKEMLIAQVAKQFGLRGP